MTYTIPGVGEVAPETYRQYVKDYGFRRAQEDLSRAWTGSGCDENDDKASCANGDKASCANGDKETPLCARLWCLRNFTLSTLSKSLLAQLPRSHGCVSAGQGLQGRSETDCDCGWCRCSAMRRIRYHSVVQAAQSRRFGQPNQGAAGCHEWYSVRR